MFPYSQSAQKPMKWFRPCKFKPEDLADYTEWFNALTEAEQNAERQLTRAGFYELERSLGMFEVKDRENQPVHLEDIVEYEQDGKPIEAVVIGLISSTEVHINPINVGPPLVVQSNQVKVIYSFVGKILSLGSMDEFKQILDNAKSRMSKEIQERDPAFKNTQVSQSVKPKSQGVKESVDL